MNQQVIPDEIPETIWDRAREAFLRFDTAPYDTPYVGGWYREGNTLLVPLGCSLSTDGPDVPLRAMEYRYELGADLTTTHEYLWDVAAARKADLATQPTT